MTTPATPLSDEELDVCRAYPPGLGELERRLLATVEQDRAAMAVLVGWINQTIKDAGNVPTGDVKAHDTFVGKVFFDGMKFMDKLPASAKSLLDELETLRKNQLPAGCVAVCNTCGRKPNDWPKYGCIAAPDCPNR